MNKNQADIIELMIRKSVLEGVKIWLNQQYIEIEKLIAEIEAKENE
jgi:hypothetical protein